jgi:hypothetical protein
LLDCVYTFVLVALLVCVCFISSRRCKAVTRMADAIIVTNTHQSHLGMLSKFVVLCH